MLNAKELRIGNWILLFESDEIRSTIVTIDNLRQILDDPRLALPMPLTVEILEKAGFVLEDRLQRGHSNTFFKKGMIEYLSYHYDGFCVYELNNLVIKHVDQLQNLYFALTGQELEINLEPTIIIDVKQFKAK